MKRLLGKLALAYARDFPSHRGKWRVMRSLLDVARPDLAGEFTERRGGLTWSLDPSDYTCQDLFWFGEKDPAELRQVLQRMPSGGVFFDVGANFGYYSVRVAARYAHAKVFAFEPNPPIFERLRRNVQLNSLSNVEAVPMGLSDHDGQAALQTRSDSSGWSRVVEGAGIQLTTLDSFKTRSQLTRLDLIKVDVEGHELAFLRGAERTIREFGPAILMEFNPPALAQASVSVDQLAGALRDLRYDILEVDQHGLRPLQSLPRGEDYVNAVCVRA